MTREEIIRMARESGAAMIHGGEHALMGDFALETFFQKAYAAGAAAEREKEKKRQRYDIHSCGPDCDRYICVAVRKARQEERNRVWTQEHWTEYERSIAAAEREACAKVCDEMASRDKLSNYYAVAAKAIRARGQQ